MKGVPIINLHYNITVDQKKVDQLFLSVDFYNEQLVTNNPYFGFRHLAEVGIKALSPGINDPITAVMSLQALAGLFAYHLQNPPK